MSKRDYLRGPGRQPQRQRGRHQEGLPAARHEVPPGSQPGGHQATEQQFKEAKEAYEVLTDPKKRSAYDQFGHAGVAGRGLRRRRAWRDGALHRHLRRRLRRHLRRGAAAPAGARNRGADLRYDLTLTLEDAVAGKEVKIRIPTAVDASSAAAAGPSPAPSPRPVRPARGTARCACSRGSSPSSRPVRQCRGSGHIIEEACTALPRRRAGAGAQDPVGQGAGRRRYRRPHPPGRGGRSARATAARPAISTSRSRSRQHPIFTREDSHLLLRGAHRLRRGGPGRRTGGADPGGQGDLKIPPGPRPARCSASAARACSRCAAARSAT